MVFSLGSSCLGSPSLTRVCKKRLFHVFVLRLSGAYVYQRLFSVTESDLAFFGS